MIERDCGATTSWATHVYLGESNEPVFVANGQPAVRLRWLREDLVRVEYGDGGRVFRQDKVRDGIKIEYVPLHTVGPRNTDRK